MTSPADEHVGPFERDCGTSPARVRKTEPGDPIALHGGIQLTGLG
jgi:hypothetical protein